MSDVWVANVAKRDLNLCKCVDLHAASLSGSGRSRALLSGPDPANRAINVV